MLVAAVPVLAFAVAAGHAAILPGPVCVPDEATVPVTADAKVSSKHPGRNYGGASRWKVNFGPATARSFIDFNLPAISDSCDITKAILSLNGNESGEPEPANAWPGANVNLYIATRSWSEGSITWNNQPPRRACLGGDQEYAFPDEWDMTGIVDDAYRCLRGDRIPAWYGLKLRGWSPRGSDAHWRASIDSRESAHPPVVHISWE